MSDIKLYNPSNELIRIILFSLEYSPDIFNEAVADLVKNIEKLMNTSDVKFNGLNLAPLINISYNSEPAIWDTLQQLQQTYINMSDFDISQYV